MGMVTWRHIYGYVWYGVRARVDPRGQDLMHAPEYLPTYDTLINILRPHLSICHLDMTRASVVYNAYFTYTINHAGAEWAPCCAPAYPRPGAPPRSSGGRRRRHRTRCTSRPRRRCRCSTSGPSRPPPPPSPSSWWAGTPRPRRQPPGHVSASASLGTILATGFLTPPR